MTDLQDGTYTVVAPSGAYQTYQITTQKRGGLVGKTIISFLSGPDNERDFMGCAFYDHRMERVYLWKRYANMWRQISLAIGAIRCDPLQAGELYAMRSGRCSKCQKVLTVPASLHRGMGATCAAKYGGGL